MLILAGASLNVLVGQNGILKKAQEAVMAYKDADLDEKIEMDKVFGGNGSAIECSTITERARMLQDKYGYSVAITEQNTIVVADYDNMVQYTMDIDGNKSNETIISAAGEEYFTFNDATGTLTMCTYNDGSYYVRSWTNDPPKNLVIPKYFAGKEVKGLVMWDRSEDRFPDFESLTIPNGITSISLCGNKLKCCQILLPSGLKSMELDIAWSKGFKNPCLPNGLTSIGNDMFRNNDVDEEIDIPSSLKSIGSRAFQNCIIKRINLHNTTHIGYYAFYGSKLTEVTFDNVNDLNVNAYGLYPSSRLTINGVSSFGGLGYNAIDTETTADVVVFHSGSYETNWMTMGAKKIIVEGSVRYLSPARCNPEEIDGIEFIDLMDGRAANSLKYVNGVSADEIDLLICGKTLLRVNSKESVVTIPGSISDIASGALYNNSWVEKIVFEGRVSGHWHSLCGAENLHEIEFKSDSNRIDRQCTACDCGWDAFNGNVRAGIYQKN